MSSIPDQETIILQAAWHSQNNNNNNKGFVDRIVLKWYIHIPVNNVI